MKPKKLLSVLLVMVMLLTCIPLGAVSASAYCDECGGVGYKWYSCQFCGGDGCRYCDYLGSIAITCRYCIGGSCTVCGNQFYFAADCFVCDGDGCDHCDYYGEIEYRCEYCADFCANCGGDGYEWYPCEFCDGDAEECRFCDYWGAIEPPCKYCNEREYTCTVCEGVGYYYWCFDCRGNGCRKCDYTGEIEYPCEYCSDEEYTCADCGGDGIIVALCDACSGAGCDVCDQRGMREAECLACDYQYSISGGKAIITKYLGDGGDVVIPSTLGGCPVMGISSKYTGDGVDTEHYTGSFEGCETLTSVVIPEGVTYISESAFAGCTALESVVIPSTVTRMSGAFEYCKNLSAVYISDLEAWCKLNFYENIGGSIYSNPLAYAKNLYLNNELVTDLVIPEGITKINHRAFVGCSMNTVTIPDGVTSIWSSAFLNCANLTTVTLPDSITYIGMYAFDWCDQLSAVYYNGTKVEAFEIEEGNEALLNATWYYNGEPGPSPGDCVHQWADATCTTPKTCILCGMTEGHPWACDWADATCTAPTTCKRCGKTIGEALGHTYTGLSCTDSKVCTRCGETTGEVMGHDYADATCTTPATCKRCGETTGEASSHIYDDNCDEYCNLCSAWREGIHEYSNDCDYFCNICSVRREAPHSYAGACVAMCKDCGGVRDVYHEYDGSTDTNCNLCGSVRAYLTLDATTSVLINALGEEIEFIITTEETAYYTFSTDTRNTHGALTKEDGRQVAYWYYGEDDTYKLEAGVTYFIRTGFSDPMIGEYSISVQKHFHSYENNCDDNCNICAAWREAPHNYESACDHMCNDCGKLRTNFHVWDDVYDTTCGACGATRQVNYITVEQDVIAEIVDGVPAEFVFIPERSGKYRFYSTSDSDTYGYLLDANREELAHNDDGGEGSNFKITYSLVAGTPYILRCRFYRNDDGSFTVSADLTHPHVYSNDCDSDCNDCEEERVAPHSYSGACDEYCNACGTKREGVACHDWAGATYSAPKTCTVCGATEGEPLSQDGYSPDVAHSAMETDNGNGLAFWFELSAKGVVKEHRNVANLENATINYLGRECKLVAMGAVMTNDAAVGTTEFTLEDVHGDNVIDVPVVYLQEADADSCAFAIRIIDIPDSALEHTIYARPYYVVEVDGQLITVYGDVDAASCAEYL